jgi:hypothetical protein
MKQILGLLLLLSLILTLGCRSEKHLKKTDQFSEEARREIMERFKVEDINMISFNTLSSYRDGTQKMFFNFMDAASRARVWKEKIQLVYSITKEEARKTQLFELLKLITPELYSANNQDLVDQVYAWANKNRKLFGLQNEEIILFKLNKVALRSTSDDYVDVEGDDYEANPCPPNGCSSCNCNQSNHSESCDPCGGGNYCESLSTGCGYLGTQSCDGICNWN